MLKGDNPLVLYAALPLASYLVASTPFATLIARGHGVDLREHGSGNLGATNVARVIGVKWGILCFFLDVLKGFAPVFLAGWLLTGWNDVLPSVARQFSWICVGMAAVVGHCLSVWLRFKGGKGVATGLGVVLGVWPYFTLPGLVAFGLWIVVTVRTRYISVASMIGAVVFTPLFVAYAAWRRGWEAVEALWPLVLFAVAIGVMIVVCHRSNIVRLLAGTESKIGGDMPAVDPGVKRSQDAAE